MSYLKHKNGEQPKKSSKKGDPAKSASGLEEAINRFSSIVSTYVSDARTSAHEDSGLTEIASHLEAIHNSLKSYNFNACDGEMTFNLDLFTGENTRPVRLVLEGDAVDSIADSLKRIADAMTANGAE